jgi:hypothetical protein
LFVVHLLDDTSALRRRMAPGAGYGRDWNNGPLAVASTPVFASPEQKMEYMKS